MILIRVAIRNPAELVLANFELGHTLQESTDLKILLINLIQQLG
jgi:hypothetical protein